MVLKKTILLAEKTSVQFCEKCGSALVSRVIKSEKGESQKILQCIVCRYWLPAE